MKKKLLPLLLAGFALLCALAFTARDPDTDEETYQSGALSGLAVMEDGSLLVCDTWNKVVWYVDGDTAERFAGAVPVADLSGEPQGVYHDDAADKAYFAEPWDIAPFLNGWAVSDAGANVIRYIEDGAVYTLAGTGEAGSADGTDKTASFDRPTGLAAGGDGTLYVADTDNGAIRRVVKDGAVSTWIDGLSDPMGLCWHDGSLYVAETGRSRILKITDGTAEVLAGVSDAAEDAGEYYGGYADGLAGNARFDHPQGVAVGDDGRVYVADTLNHVVRMIRDGRVYTLAKSIDGITAPISPSGAAVRANALYITDAFTGDVLTVSLIMPFYSDVSAEAWYASDVAEATRRGLVNGTGDGEFSPEEPTTQAMLVTMLSRLHRNADGSAVIDGNGVFADVEEGSWYDAPARWAVDGGVVENADGLFHPELTISRERIAAVLYRYAAERGYDVSAVESADFDSFSDAAEISGWAADALRWAVAAGVMRGGDGLLRPGDIVTRAEAVTMLLRFMGAFGL